MRFGAPETAQRDYAVQPGIVAGKFTGGATALNGAINRRSKVLAFDHLVKKRPDIWSVSIVAKDLEKARRVEPKKKKGTNQSPKA